MSLINRLALVAAAAALAASTVFAAALPKALTDPYLRVQTALAADSTTGVPDAARAIAAAAEPLGGDAAAVVSGAKKLEAAKTLAEARDAFGDLSTAIVDYAAKTKTEVPAGIHVAFCPMNSKPWLQAEKDIKNPYYGTSMLTCGVFKQ